MGDYEKAIEGARQYLFALQQADGMRLASLLQEMVSKAAGAEAYVKAKQKEVEEAKTALEAVAAQKADQDLRVAQAKQAADEIVKACAELADKARADKAQADKELAQRVYEIQMEQGRRQAKMDEDMKKYMAEMNAAKAATRKVYDEERAKLMAELASKAERVKELQAAYDALKAKFA